MQKLGILTYHHITNFGAFLQAYSLQEFLRIHNFSVEMIDYRPLRAVVREYAKIIRPLIQFQFKKAYHNWKILTAFSKAQKLLIQSKKTTFYFASVKSVICDYDILITGSDEIWNTASYLKYLPAYFLDFPPIKNQKRLSYAASMGQAKPTPRETTRASQALSRFNGILARDNATLNWVNELGKNTSLISPKKVVDPTLLYDIEVISPSEKKYLLLTGTLNHTQISLAVSWAKAKNINIISAGYIYAGFEEYAVIGLSPLEWAGYVKNADFHLTSLFHGSIFSLKNNRPFAVIQNPEKANKIGDLLDMFHLSSHIIKPEFTLSEFETAVHSGFPDNHSDTMKNLRLQSSEVFLNTLKS
jgi:hypothetical protein